MGKVNAILSCLLAGLAIAAGVLSFMLFDRRNEFRGRAEVLATTLTEVVGTLDKQSSTRNAEAITFTAADPLVKTPETGTLSWKAYHDAKGLSADYAEFASTLSRVQDQTAKFHAQRAELAQHLLTISKTLGLPAAKVEQQQLQNLVDTTAQDDALAQLIAHVQAVTERDQTMLAALARLSDTLRTRFDRDAFLRRQESADENQNPILGDYNISLALQDLEDTATALRQRCESYRDTLLLATATINKHEWETKKYHIEDERDYPIALQTLQNDFTQINEKLILLEKTQNELDKTRTELEIVSAELKQKRDDLAALQDTLQATQIRREQLADRVRTLQPPDDDGAASEPLLVKRSRVQGKVLRVDEQWNFVVVDLGHGIVSHGTRLLIARGEDCVASIEISKVLGSISVAEILPDLRQSQIMAGDKVIFPFQDASQN